MAQEFHSPNLVLLTSGLPLPLPWPPPCPPDCVCSSARLKKNPVSSGSLTPLWAVFTSSAAIIKASRFLHYQMFLLESSGKQAIWLAHSGDIFKKRGDQSCDHEPRRRWMCCSSCWRDGWMEFSDISEGSTHKCKEGRREFFCYCKIYQYEKKSRLPNTAWRTTDRPEDLMAVEYVREVLANVKVNSPKLFLLREIDTRAVGRKPCSRPRIRSVNETSLTDHFLFTIFWN